VISLDRLKSRGTFHDHKSFENQGFPLILKTCDRGLSVILGDSGMAIAKIEAAPDSPTSLSASVSNDVVCPRGMP
jgi:hypothetical protein